MLDIQEAIIYKDLRLNACVFNTFAIVWGADFKNLCTHRFEQLQNAREHKLTQQLLKCNRPLVRRE